MSWRSSSLEISARLPPDLARLEQRDRSLSLHVVPKMTEHADSMMLFQWVRFSLLGRRPHASHFEKKYHASGTDTPLRR